MGPVVVSLPSPLNDWVEEKVRNGEYASASDYLVDLVRSDRDQPQSRSGFYHLSDNEERDVREVLEEVERGDLASEAEIAELSARYR